MLFPQSGGWLSDQDNFSLMTSDTISWPALIRVSNDSELLVVHSTDTLADPNWRLDAGFLRTAQTVSTSGGSGLLGASLELIDSNGRLFEVELKGAVSIECTRTSRHYDLSEVVNLVQQHAALQGHCCIAKITAGTIPQAIQLVEHLNNE